MPLVELTEYEIWLIKMMILTDTNDGMSHPEHDKLYDKLEKVVKY